jgi:hypothetical protein
MGVTGGHKLTFRLLNLNFEHLLTIARKRHADSGDDGGNCKPSIYIDASWISPKLSIRKGGPIAAILDIATCFAKEGLHITIVCDGAQRHDSKHASVERQSKQETSRIMAHAMRADIIIKKTALSAATGTGPETNLRQEIQQLSARLSKTASVQNNFVLASQGFYKDLKEATT